MALKGPAYEAELSSVQGHSILEEFLFIMPLSTIKVWEGYLGKVTHYRLLVTLFKCFQLFTIFKCLNQAVLAADVAHCKFKQENQSKASE